MDATGEAEASTNSPDSSYCPLRVLLLISRQGFTRRCLCGNGHWQACRDADACARPTSLRSKKAAGAIPRVDFRRRVLVARMTTAVLCRVMDAVSNQLIVDAGAAGYERRTLSGPQGPRPQADMPARGRAGSSRPLRTKSRPPPVNASEIQNTAIGLTGEPVPRGIGNGAMVNMNSHRLRAAAASLRASKSARSMRWMPRMVSAKL